MSIRSGWPCSALTPLFVALCSMIGAGLRGQSPMCGPIDGARTKEHCAGFIALNKNMLGWYTVRGQVTFTDSALIFTTDRPHPVLRESIVIPFRSIRGIHHGTGLWDLCMSEGDPIAIGLDKRLRAQINALGLALLKRSECRTESHTAKSTEGSPCDPSQGIPGWLKLSKHFGAARYSVPGCFYQGDTRFSPQVKGTLGSFFRPEIELTHLRHRKVYDRAFLRKLRSKD